MLSTMRPTKYQEVLIVRVSKEHMRKIEELAQNSEVTLSTVVRFAIDSVYANESPETHQEEKHKQVKKRSR